MGNYSAAMLAEVQSPAPALMVLLDLEMPGSTRRYASTPVVSSSLGQYAGQIVSMGNLHREASSISGEISYPTLGDITVEDTAGTLGLDLELSEPSGVGVTLRLASPDVDPSGWLVLATNFVLDDWRQERAHRWTLSFTFDDQPLRSPFPRTPILRPDFPNVADPVLYTYYVQIAYGIHDSRNAGDKGQVPAPYVDTVNGWFGPWLGWITIDRVYKNDTLQTSGWTTLHTTINGRLYTLIDFTTPPAVTDVVTADITGYTDGTDGAGDLLTGADALKHLLVNWVYPAEDWKSGAWLADATAPVSVAHFAEMQTFLEAMGWEPVSKQFGGEKRLTGEEGLNSFCQSFGKAGSIGSLVTPDGKIAVRPNDHRTTVLYQSGTRHLRHEKNVVAAEPDEFSLQHERTLLTDRINVRYLPNAVDDSYKWALEVRDLAVARGASSDLELPWSDAQVQ